jgi:DNA-binding CsgD family transcriptional regulator
MTYMACFFEGDYFVNKLDLLSNVSGENYPSLLPLYLTSIVSFSDGMHGKAPLERVIEDLAISLEASAAMISRTRIAGERPQAVTMFDSTKCVSVRRLARSYAQEVVGETLDLHGAGTASFFSDSELTVWTCNPALSLWMEKRSIQEIAILHLSTGKRSRDTIELHFSEQLSKPKKLAIVALAGCLARVYATRQLGLFVEAIARRKNTSREISDLNNVPILSHQNPAGLTRMEYRVCTLVGRGLASKTVAGDLAVSINTVRTHLRHIYAKTGYANYYELSHRLVSLSERFGMQFDNRLSG